MHNLKMPTNFTLWVLHNLLDQACRWRDHASNREDFDALDDFIGEIERTLDDCIQQIDYLERCFAADHD